MKDKFKPWQRWVLFALAMAVIFASGSNYFIPDGTQRRGCKCRL